MVRRTVWVCRSIVAVAISVLAAPLEAHGGGYRAPIPVNPGVGVGVGAAVLPGGAGGPAAPGGRSGPVTAGPRVSSAPSYAQPVGGSAALTAASGGEQTRWQLWWEFNKDAYLQVKATVTATRASGAHPTLEQIDRELLPALSRTLQATRQPDLASACLVALGKILPSASAPALRELFVAGLRNGVQETRETAALALGISRRPWVVDDLLAVMTDDRVGRRLTDRERIDDRTRTFAAYGLGLVAENCDDMKLRGRIIAALRGVLERTTGKDLDLALGAVHGLRLACPAPNVRSLESWTLTQDVVDRLWQFAMRRAGKSEQVVQAQAMLAVARILALDDSGIAVNYTEAIVEELAERESRPVAFAQSAAIAAGFMVRPTDEAACAALRRLAQFGKDRMARSFALIALGQIGGDDNRAFLLKTLAQGHKVTVKPWAALALGVLRHRARAHGSAQASEDRIVGRELLEALNTVKTADARGAFAIALGLAGHASAASGMRALLADNAQQDEFAGYLGIGLALLGDQGAVPLLRDTAKGALRRPHLLRQLAVALGILGDRGAAAYLLELLRAGDLNVATLGSVAGALGQVGDAGCLGPLTKLIGDERVPDLARAFAAAAVGGIVDDDLLPWNASLSLGVNYAAALPSLTDGLSGVLDIL